MMKPAPSNPSPGSPLRRWAARITLLVACVGTVATSQPRSPEVTAEHSGQPVRLTAEAPRATLDFVIRVSAKDADYPVEGEVWAELTPRWQPTDANREQRPSLRAKLSVGDDFNDSSYTHVLEPGGNPGTFTGPYGSIPYGCTLDKSCEWSGVLDLELLDAAAGDVVDVDWKVIVNAAVRETSNVPDGFTVTVSEP